MTATHETLLNTIQLANDLSVPRRQAELRALTWRGAGGLLGKTDSPVRNSTKHMYQPNP
jgi:hypothetical protein